MAQITLDMVADGPLVGYSLTGAATRWEAVSDAALDDTSYVSSSVLNAATTFYAPNVTTGQIPDFSTINWVQMTITARRVGGGPVRTAMGVYNGSNIPDDRREDASPDVLSSTSYLTYDHQLTTDPFTSAAWDLDILRAWRDNATTTDRRAFGFRADAVTTAQRITRVQVVVDYTEGSPPSSSWVPPPVIF